MDDHGKKDENENLDFVLERYVGGAGRYQYRTYAGMFPIPLVTSVVLYIHLFAAYTPEHRCRVDVCDGVDAVEQFNGSFVQFAIPAKSKDEGFLNGVKDMDNCQMFRVKDLDAGCSEDNFDHG